MGRITVFVADGCSPSQQTETALHLHKLPFVTINITKYPSKRADLLALSGRLHTPQVYFNTRHVGGAPETIALLNKWGKNCFSSQECAPIVATSPSSIMSLTSKKSRRSSSRTVGSSSKDSVASSKGSVASSNNSATMSSKRKEYASVYERYMDEVGQHPDPVDKRLACPDTPPERLGVMFARVQSSEFCITLPGDVASTVLETTEMLRDLIHYKVDHVVNGVTHKRSFYGHQVTKILQNVFAIPLAESKKYAGQMLDCEIFHSLQGKSHPSRVFDEKALYRLHCYHTPDVLNSYREWKEDMILDGMTLLDCLLDMLQAMDATVIDQDGVVDLAKVGKLAQFPVFEEATCALQTVDLDEMDETTKMVRTTTLELPIIPHTPCASSRFDVFPLLGVWHQRVQSHDKVCNDQGGACSQQERGGTRRILLGAML
jgi:glutaredoxin